MDSNSTPVNNHPSMDWGQKTRERLDDVYGEKENTLEIKFFLSKKPVFRFICNQCDELKQFGLFMATPKIPNSLQY